MQRFLAEARSWIARSRSSLVAPHQAGDEDFAERKAEARRTLEGAGEVRSLLRAWDARQRLGPLELWPRTLVTALRICLDAPTPMWLFWGPDAALMYNDAVVALLGRAHPQALGRPAAETQTELWEVSEPAVEAVLSSGRPRRLADQLLLVGEVVEERYFDIQLSPLMHGGEVAGVLCSATETTQRVQTARRAAMLAELASRTATAPTEDEMWAEAVAALELDPADLPYALVYAADPSGDAATLKGTVGLPSSSPRVPQRLDPSSESPWPHSALLGGEPVRVQDALVCPLIAPGGAVRGVLVAGLNPRQPFDDEYRAFVTAAADRLAASAEAVRSRDEYASRAASLERGRRRLEQRCAELTRLFELAPIPIIVVSGKNFVVQRINEAALVAADYRDLLGNSLFDAVPELLRQGFDQRLVRVRETGVPDIGREVRVRLERDGRMEDRCYTFISAPLETGENSQIIIVASDVTEQVRARAALEASEASYRNIFDGVDVSIWVVDVTQVLPQLDELAAAGVDDLRAYLTRHPEFLAQALDSVSIVDINRATLGMFGARDKDELLRSLHKVFVSESWQAFSELLIAVHENRQLVRTDAVVRTLAGGRREFMMTIAPIATTAPATPRPTRVLVTMADITERKRMEQALRETDRQKDEFLATLAHELRNPLAPLRSSVDLLRTVRGEAPEPVLDIVERQVEHLVRLADDLFESSRIRQGEYDLRKERLPLAEALRDAMETIRTSVQSKGHELDVRMPDEPLWVDGDRTRLSQVFGNLLNNAVRYTPEPGRIILEAVRMDSQVEVSVTDTGVGIPPEAMPKLFTMFSRYRGAEDADVAGLGIGLALAKQLVEAHGGSIEARSEGRGKGATFIVRLPLNVDTGPKITEAAPAQAERSIGGRRLLIVEDDRDTAESLKMILEANGAEVRIASSGPKALATFASFEPDAVLLDIGLPGMDGYEVARRLRAEFASRSVPIVALTGWGRTEDIKRARDAGFDDHLVKPVDIDALRRLLSRMRSADPRGAAITRLDEE